MYNLENVIILNEWYGKLESDLLPKNKKDKVEVLETEIKVGNDDVGEKNFMFDGSGNKGFDYYNEILGESDSIYDNIIKCKNGVASVEFSFNNTTGDLRKENFSLDISCDCTNNTIDKNNFSKSENYTLKSFPGLLINSITKIITSEIGGSLSYIMEVNSTSVKIKIPTSNGKHLWVYQYFKFVIPDVEIVLGQSQINNINVKLRYGKYIVGQQNIIFGDGNNSYSVKNNTLIETQATNDGIRLSNKNSNEILKEWKNGRQIVSIEVPLRKWYNANGQLIIDNLSNNNEIYFKIEVGMIVTFKEFNKYIYVRQDGSPKLFQVVVANTNCKGKITQKLECVEIEE